MGWGTSITTAFTQLFSLKLILFAHKLNKFHKTLSPMVEDRNSMFEKRQLNSHVMFDKTLDSCMFAC